MFGQNNQNAKENRTLFRHLLSLNLLSSPGSGKTTLIERLLQDLDLITKHPDRPILAGVIVGDLATDHDAEKLRKTGTPTIQINTGNLCHLEAAGVAKAAQQLDLAALDLLIIENVGNLVCPALYDLGEDLRIVVMSVTEGEDKPLKYPATFKSADAVVISKCDIAAAVGFNRAGTMAYLSQVVPQAQVFEVSAKTGEGLGPFYGYLKQVMGSHQARAESYLLQT
ncbi:MAG: hydrogenase nickel incorporation protein HypB [Phormidesmis sp. RL_2_1]|nr:hydrogenase nickel incorporation protein HypB [Phormidesmis sp. RL_2_1]